MTTVRLPAEIEHKLEIYARKKHISKTALIKEALEQFFTQNENDKDSYELGKNYFGKYGSGDGSLSTTYKKRIKRKISAKLNSN